MTSVQPRVDTYASAVPAGNAHSSPGVLSAFKPGYWTSPNRAGGAEKSLSSAAKWDTKALRGLYKALWSKRSGGKRVRGRAYCACA
jgi:hypothetical protein